MRPLGSHPRIYDHPPFLLCLLARDRVGASRTMVLRCRFEPFNECARRFTLASRSSLAVTRSRLRFCAHVAAATTLSFGESERGKLFHRQAAALPRALPTQQVAHRVSVLAHAATARRTIIIFR